MNDELARETCCEIVRDSRGRLKIEQPYDPDSETMVVARSATGYLVMTTGGQYVELQS